MSARTKNNTKFLLKHNGIENLLSTTLDDSLLGPSARKFLQSLQKYYSENGGLTKKQYNALNDIHLTILERKTKEHEEWCKHYDKKKRKIASICAKYYEANPPYFSYLSSQILNDPEFIPTKTQFKSMCENKFTEKVVRAAFSKPVFNEGEMVQVRKSAPLEFKDKLAVVVKSEGTTIINAAKGAKTYVLLPVGTEELFECEERFLKKTKRS